MKLIISLMIIAVTGVAICAQTKKITATDYDGTLQRAVVGTNAAFPFVFTVFTETYEKGKPVSTETDVTERQAQGVDRQIKTFVKDGKTLRSYSVMVGFGNHTYCSSDGVSWRGPQKFVCPGPENTGFMMLGAARMPTKVDYTVMEKSLNGQKVKVYRKYSVFSSSEPKEKDDFEEEIATIDGRGFFISVDRNEGTLNPKATTTTNKQTWDFKKKFEPVVAPK